MQFKNFIILSVLIGLIALTFGTRLLNKNNNKNKVKTSVFASENFQISEDEKLDDLMEQRRMAMRKMNIRNPKSKIIITFHLNL